MRQLAILLLVGATSSLTYFLGLRLLGLNRSLSPGIARTLETVGIAVVFFVANVALTVVAVLALRLFGIFTSLYLGTDPTIALLSCLQALVLQFWRYSGPAKA